MQMNEPRSMFQKIWDAHTILRDEESGECLLFVDRLILTDTSSFHAFDLLRAQGYRVRHPERIFGEPDHFASSRGPRLADVADEERRTLVAALAQDSAEFGVTHFGLADPRMGISHVVGPEQGITLPGVFLLCGDSHTSTHGALGALAFGIGASEVAHVLATQCLWQVKPKAMRIRVAGRLREGVFAKDLALAIIARIGMSGAVGHAVEYAGAAIEALSIEERCTLCNMTIEAGGRMGFVAPDETTIEYVRGRPMAPKGAAWEAAVAEWRELRSDSGATFDREVEIDAGSVQPMITWGTSVEQAIALGEKVPDPRAVRDDSARHDMEAALDYMGLAAGQSMEDASVDQVFIGSCTNARLSDLRAAAEVVRGIGGRARVPTLVSPGSAVVKRMAEEEGLDRVFIDAGMRWGQPGCSMCVGMNGDVVGAGKRCVSTSNRNFPGRQGRGSRTHLASPATAAMTAMTGHIAASGRK
jgi:3-isopropylmalate/(R)-2-methylmalate dehydratase large subunit